MDPVTNFTGRLFISNNGFFAEHENPNNCIKEAIGHYCMKAGEYSTTVI